jgi:ribonuclease Z
MATLHIIGSGSAIASARRQNTSLALAHDALVLIDCSGNPVSSLEKQGLSPWELDCLVLTHRHTDHIYGVPSLVHQLFLQHVTNPRGPLRILGENNAINAVRGLLESSGLWNRPGCFNIETEVVSMKGGTRTISSMDLEFFPVSHGSTPTLGITWLGSNTRRTLVYSCDTEPVAAVWQRAIPGSLLVHECSSFSGDSLSGHTSLPQVRKHAKDSKADIILVHLPPATVSEEEAVETMLSMEFGARVMLGYDGLTIDLG